MDKDAVESVTKIVSVVNTLDQNKFYILVILGVLLGAGYFVRWYVSYKSQQKTDSLITGLTDSISNFSDILHRHETSSGGRMTELIGIMGEIRDRQKNVIGKTDSVRIIINKFNDVVKREILTIFEWSIINNDYKSRKQFVKRKVKSAIADSINMARRSLSEFNLSVDLEQFFITYKNAADQNVHLKIVDQLWDEVALIYEREKPTEEAAHTKMVSQQIEEMQIAVNNVITAELTKIQLEINNLYR